MKERPSRNKQARREEWYKAKYGIDQKDFDNMKSLQGGSCAICGIDDYFLFRVDHCHETNLVRGLLCAGCNTMLGLAKDNVEVLKSAISYLENELGGDYSIVADFSRITYDL
jgi:hypothetical protein